MRNHNPNVGSCVALLGVWLAACGRDSVSLGDDGQTESFALRTTCAGDPLIEGDVRVTSQAELAALAGCEEISGDLDIEGFDGVDLRPLAALKAVGGRLTIGGYSTTFPVEPTSALVDAGGLESFAGVEALERVGALWLGSFAASDLSPFSSLRDIDPIAQDGTRGGDVTIISAKNLVDLRGLSGVGGITMFSVDDAPSLESLDGLLMGSRLRSLNITKAPMLKNIDALAPVERCDTIVIADTALEDLRGLAALQRVDTMAIVENPLLADASSFPRLSVLRDLYVESNPKLSGSLEIPANYRLTTVMIDRNDELERVNFLGPNDFTCGNIYIAENERLRSVGGPGGCAIAGSLEVSGNPSLESFDLDGLTELEELHVRDNPRLSGFAHADLERIDTVEIVNNPLLSVISLTAIPAFERTIEGNSDSPAP